MLNICMLGAGAMGSRMAVHLLNAGHPLTIWNRDAQKVEKLVQQGAKAALSPRQGATGADVVISMVRDDDASRRVWLAEEDGALDGLSDTAIGIESSTLTVDWITELAGHFSGRSATLLDAPVAGSLPQAEAGQLIFLVGGEATIFEQCRELLMTMGGAVHHAGPTGSGSAIKLMINALYGIQLAAAGELTGLARSLGLNLADAAHILASTPVCSPAVKAALGAMVTNNFKPMFPIELVVKDFAYALKTAQSNQADLPLTNAAGKIFEKAMEAGYGKDNITGVAQLYK